MNHCERQSGFEERTTGMKDWLTGVKKKKEEKSISRLVYILEGARSFPLPPRSRIHISCRIEVQITKVGRLNKESTSRRVGNR